MDFFISTIRSMLKFYIVKNKIISMFFFIRACILFTVIYIAYLIIEIVLKDNQMHNIMEKVGFHWKGQGHEMFTPLSIVSPN